MQMLCHKGLRQHDKSNRYISMNLKWLVPAGNRGLEFCGFAPRQSSRAIASRFV
jgi:hypothetical protein